MTGSDQKFHLSERIRTSASHFVQGVRNKADDIAWNISETISDPEPLIIAGLNVTVNSMAGLVTGMGVKALFMEAAIGVCGMTIPAAALPILAGGLAGSATSIALKYAESRYFGFELPKHWMLNSAITGFVPGALGGMVANIPDSGAPSGPTRNITTNPMDTYYYNIRPALIPH